MKAYPRVTDIPDPVDVAVIAIPAATVLDVVDDCAAKGVEGLIVISAGFAEVGDSDRSRAASSSRRAPPRHAAHRPELHGRGEHRSATSRMNATFAPSRPVPRTGRVRVAVGRARHRAARPGRRASGSAISAFVSMGNKADVSEQRPAPVLGGRPEHRRDPALPRVVREPAQVRAARAPHRTHEADRRGEERPHAAPGTRARRLAHRRARDPRRRRRRAVPAGRRRPRRHARRAVRHRAGCSSHQPLPAGSARRDRRATAAGPASSPPTRATGAGLEVPELSTRHAGRAAGVRLRPTRGCATRWTSSHRRRRDVRAMRSASCSPTRTSTRCSCIFVPPLVTEAADVARAIVGRQRRRRRRSRSRVLPRPRRTCPTIAAACADERAHDPVRSRFPRRPRVALERAAPTSPSGAAGPRARCRRSPGIDLGRRPAARGAELAEPPGGGLARPAERRAAAASCFGIPVACRRVGADRRRGGRGRRRARATPSRSRRAPPSSCTRPTSAACASASPTPTRCAHAFAGDGRTRSATRMGGASCSRWSQPGVETIVGVTQDPLFGPLVLFGMGGVTAELVRDTVVAARARSPTSTPTTSCGRCGRRRCCSATAARPRSTSPRSRTCCCVSACSPTTCPRSPSSTPTR